MASKEGCAELSQKIMFKLLKKILKRNIYLDTVWKIYKILDVKQRRGSILMIGLIITNGFIDVLGLAVILPVIASARPSAIATNGILQRLYQLSGLSNPDHFFEIMLLVMFIVFLFKNFAGVFFSYLQTNYAFQVGIELTTKQFKVYLKKDYLFFKSTNSNIIMRDIASIPMEFSSEILVPIMMMTSEFFVILLIAIGMAMYDIEVFATAIIVLLPAFLFFYYISRKKIVELGELRNQMRPKTFKNMFETIFGYVDVKLANRDNYFISKSAALLKDFYKVMTKLLVIESIPIRLIEMSAVAGVAVVFMYFIITGKDRLELLGFLVLFATAAYRMMPSMNRILNSLIKIKAATYVFELLDHTSTLNYSIELDNNGTVERLNFEKNIHLKDVSYTYPDKTDHILNNIDLKINKNEHIGVIGPSGSGKTTLVNLLLRFLHEKEGQLLVDGKILSEEKQPSWRRIIGYVQQDFFLLDSDLAENIAFGRTNEEIDFEKISIAIEQANLTDLVNSWPEGVHTKVGEFGAKLSGGQRQRIAIARALYKEPEILIFDEATSALDMETERAILETIQNISDQKLTVIMITHRISSLKHCSIIYELKNGEISRSYNYQELLATND